MLVPPDDFIRKALLLWALPEDSCIRLINVSENATYEVLTPRLSNNFSHRYILRLHRVGYHTRHAIECELDWLVALQRDLPEIRTPKPIAGCDGACVQSQPFNDEKRNFVLFEHLPGDHPSEEDDLTVGFQALGQIAARTHLHSQGWKHSEQFERLTWDDVAILGVAPRWGHWSDGPGVGEAERSCLLRVESEIMRRLEVFGRQPERWGLIHGDMRLANLLLNGDHPPALIDFDDCGFSWFLYDFAAAISFIEDSSKIANLLAAWLQGYRRVTCLSDEDIAIIPTLVMLRRLALLGWLGTHPHANEAQTLGKTFADKSARLGNAYLEGSYLLK